MPFQINYTDPQTSTNYPESFWVISAVNLNQLTQTATVSFDGFPTVNDFNLGNGRITSQQFAFNSTAEYQTLLEFQFESRNSIYSFYALVEQAVNEISDFFVGGVYIQWSIYRPVTLEVGAESETRVNVIYSGDEITGISSGDGVLIQAHLEKVITAANLVGGYTDRAYYDISPKFNPGDIALFSYDAASGFMADAQLLPIRSLGPLTITNTIGMRLLFNMAGNSGHADTSG